MLSAKRNTLFPLREFLIRANLGKECAFHLGIDFGCSLHRERLCSFPLRGYACLPFREIRWMVPLRGLTYECVFL